METTMKAYKEMRVWFALFAVLPWAGIFLSGFANIHWLLYIPRAGLTFAAITGICPSQIATNKMIGVNKS
jgi:hypothetical protein